MAYVDQQRKKELATLVKKTLPKWKFSFAVHNHSTLVVTIKSAPIDLIKNMAEMARERLHEDVLDAERAESHAQHILKRGAADVNPYWLDRQFKGQALVDMTKLLKAVNSQNHDRSDIQTDYFDVGYYVNLSIGSHKKPFEVK